MLFGFVLVGGVIALYILMNLYVVCCWIAYMIAFWCLGSHNEDIVRFWCRGKMPMCTYFSKFFKTSKRFFFFFGNLCSFFDYCNPMC